MEKIDPERHHRQTLRLPGYDYSQAGAYFVTIQTYQRTPLFGKIVGGEMLENAYGKIVEQVWVWLGQKMPGVQPDLLGVMPDHIHGIVVIQSDPIITNRDPNIKPADIPHGPTPVSLGAVVGQFKSRVTRRLWEYPRLSGTPIWQRNYYDVIIRDERIYAKVCEYIQSNPSRWRSGTNEPAVPR